MSQFRFYIKNITCNNITDSMLEGNEDELYVKVWHEGFICNIVKEEIPLGSFAVEEKIEIEKVIFEQNLPEINALGFDFYDSDVFSDDDYLGSFIINPKNQISPGRDTKYQIRKDDFISYLTLMGNGCNFNIEFLFEAI